MVAALAAQLGCEIYPVHRLDKETGGVMVYAKTAQAAAKLSADVAAGRLQKTYLAVVKGDFPNEQGEMRDLLFRDQQRNKSFVVQRQRKGVKEAILQYERLESRDALSLMKVTLVTGRTHQIRVQFASRGYPLIGDRRYGGNTAPCLALWAHTLSFPHPITDTVLTFSAAPTDSAVFANIYTRKEVTV
jgi:23S rRNA pseudouridine1911/1915/1917 synthase